MLYHHSLRNRGISDRCTQIKEDSERGRKTNLSRVITLCLETGKKRYRITKEISRRNVLNLIHNIIPSQIRQAHLPTIQNIWIRPLLLTISITYIILYLIHITLSFDEGVIRLKTFDYKLLRQEEQSHARDVSFLYNNGNLKIRKGISNLATFGYRSDSFSSSRVVRIAHFPTNHQYSSTDLKVNSKNSNLEKQERVGRSKYYDSKSPLLPYKNNPECVPMHKWQSQSFPTCNMVHEVNLRDWRQTKSGHTQVQLLGHGYYRSVWKVRDYDGFSPIAIKTINYDKHFDPRTYDVHRIDAMVMERMTSSPHIMDIYSFCAQSGLFEFADGGSMDDLVFGYVKEKMPKNLGKLRYAVAVAKATEDLHSFESIQGHSAVVHADIVTDQIVKSNGHFKLNDFNRAHLMYWNKTSNNGTCPYIYPGSAAGQFRAPEEYQKNPLTESIDVYALGNVFYTIFTESYPFQKELQKYGMKNVHSLIKKGSLPELSEKIINSTYAIDRIFIKAMRMCFEYDGRKRPSASQVRFFLENKLFKVETKNEKAIIFKQSRNRGHHERIKGNFRDH